MGSWFQWVVRQIWLFISWIAVGFYDQINRLLAMVDPRVAMNESAMKIFDLLPLYDRTVPNIFESFTGASAVLMQFLYVLSYFINLDVFTAVLSLYIVFELAMVPFRLGLLARRFI